jgi:hypothetical protein
MRLLACLLPIVAVLGAPAGRAAASLAVPLVVSEPGDGPRHAFPASASVPLPRGLVREPGGLWLAAPDRHATLLQTGVLGRWPDGSLRWIHLDFLADVPAGGHATYTLHDGKAPPIGPSAHLRSEVRQGARAIDTGRLHATVPLRGDALWTDVHVDGHHLGTLPLPALTIEGRPAVAASPADLQVETDGPVRAELLYTGRYAAGLTYELRVSFFAGQSFVRLEHTVTSVSDDPYLRLRSLALSLPGAFETGAVGIDGVERTLATLEPPHTLFQPEADVAILDDGPPRRRADGWARAVGDGVAVTLVAPYFWQEYPKAFLLEAGRLTLDLFAGTRTPVELGSGAAKTHEVWIAIEPASAADHPGTLARRLALPLVAVPPAAWTVASRALPQALAPDTPAARDFLARLGAAYARYRDHVATERWDDGPIDACDGQVPAHPRVGLYGVLNWGDWQFPGFHSRTHGCEAWGNLEYDLPQVLGLGYFATGSRDFLDGLVPAVRHYRDVDIIHHAPGTPDWVGMNHPHKWRHFSFATAEKIDLGHTWTEGLITYYRLTGDVRALTAARGIADALAVRVSKARNPRQFGWPMIALAGVYDATAEPRYRDALGDYATAAIIAYRPTPASGDWKMGILADGMAYAHAATGDARFRRWLTDYAEALLAEPGRYPDPRFALPLGYLASLTGDSRYAARARAAAADLKPGAWGKPLAEIGRTGFRLLAPLGPALTVGTEAAPRAAPPRGPASGGPPRTLRPAPAASPRKSPP